MATRTPRAQVADIGKALNLALSTVCVTILLATGRVGETMGVGLLCTIVGYLVGNGVNALRGRAPSPVVVPADHRVVSDNTLAALLAELGPDAIARVQAAEAANAPGG